MKKSLFVVGGVMAFMAQSLCADTSTQLPTEIKDGNILHCFSWPMKYVKEELPAIAEAGFGAIQLSPLQRPDIKEGQIWYDVYRPYDFCFHPSAMGTADDLRDLCAEAEKYGIKIVVDVVNNHIDANGPHDAWWNVDGHQRSNPSGINYGNRYSITHGQLGNYGDVNTESEDVQLRAKAYIEELKSYGVKGIRFDAAKHIGLPSEGDNFWAVVTSVPDMWYYGEILGSPGPNEDIIKEYAQYISVTDSRYSDEAAKSNGGLPTSAAGSWIANYDLGGKVIYWGESHDTYSNDAANGGWSFDREQGVIDRAYAANACRKDAAALYLARPNAKGSGNIKIGKGTTVFKNRHIAQVNKFRNLMSDREESFSSTGNAVSITREEGGAVIVMKTSGEVTVPNGNGFCPEGTYIDRVSGATFTVTASEIKGKVGASGVAVLINESIDPNPDPSEFPTVVSIPGDYNLAYSGDLNNVHYWGGNDESKWPGDKMAEATGSDGKTYKVFKVPYGTSGVIFNSNGDSDKTSDFSYTGLYIMDDNGATTTPVEFPDYVVDDGSIEIPGDYNLTYSGTKENVHYWGGASSSSWPGVALTEVVASDGNTYRVAKVAEGTTGIIFNTGGDADKTADLAYKMDYVMNDRGATTQRVRYNPSAGVESVGSETGSDIRIYASGGRLYIVTPSSRNVSVTSLEGITITLKTREGTNTFDHLPHGFYIVDGTKVIL